MTTWEITDIKNFMNKLLLTETFDGFLFEEGEIKGALDMKLDGHLNTGYFNPETLEDMKQYGDCVKYGEIRHIILESVKGKNTPNYFKIVFKADRTLQQDVANVAEFSTDDISGLFINVTFREGTLKITDGTAIKVFTLDKSIDKSWQNRIQNFLEKGGFNWHLSAN